MQEQIKKIVDCLKKGETILFPTDTIWGIGCDATNAKAVSKVFNIKKRPENKSMILLIDTIEHLSEYVKSIPENLETFLLTVNKPTTVIYQYKKGLPKSLIANDNTIAFRICLDNFCLNLIKEFGYPIVATSANFSGEETPTCFDDISSEIKNKVDYIVDYKQSDILGISSKIIMLEEDNKEIKVIRE